MTRGAAASGVAQQDFVELGARHLVGMWHRLVPGIGEVKNLLVVMPGRDKFRGQLFYADRAYFFGHAQLFQQGQVCRQQGFADMEARMTVFFDQGDAIALLRQQRCGGRAGRAAADDQDVAFVNGV